VTGRDLLRAFAEALPAGSVREEALAVLEAAKAPSGATVPAETPDRLLRAEEVAERLGLDVGTIYKQAKRWPFTRKLGRRCLRFSEQGLARWLDRQKLPR
jgi:predicted DNA-binding transcriptional regulator AlpA